MPRHWDLFESHKCDNKNCGKARKTAEALIYYQLDKMQTKNSGNRRSYKVEALFLFGEIKV